MLWLIVAFVCQVNSKPLIGAYFGIFDYNYDRSMDYFREIPFAIPDRLTIAFATIDNAGHLVNLMADSHEKIRNVTRLYRKANPKGKILISSDYDHGSDERYIHAASMPIEFATSVKRFIEEYQLDGYDMDWETGYNDFYVNITTVLFAACRKVLGPGYLLSYTFMPQNTNPDTIKQISPFVNQFNWMVYGSGSNWIEGLIERFSSSPKEKIFLGINSEADYDDRSTIEYKVGLADNGLGGVFMWRLDNDHQQKYVTIKIINETVNSAYGLSPE